MNNNQRLNQLLLQTRGLSSTNLEGTALIERLRKEAFALAAWSCREIDRITAERDEARREVSVLRPSVCLGVQTPDEYAKHRGWNCFKQDGMTDAEFLRCLAQNDYNIDGGLLADAVRLNEIADRIEKGHR